MLHPHPNQRRLLEATPRPTLTSQTPGPDPACATQGSEWAPCLPEQTRSSWVGPEVTRDPEEDRGLFLFGCSLRESLPRGLPGDLPRSPIRSNIIDSPINGPIQGRQGPKGFYNATASPSLSQSHLPSTPGCHPGFLPTSGSHSLPA